MPKCTACGKELFLSLSGICPECEKREEAAEETELLRLLTIHFVRKVSPVFNQFKKLPLWQQWLWVSAAGGTTVWLLLSVVGGGDPDSIALLAVWVGQWLLLRGHVRGAGWWILVSVSFGLVGGVFGAGFGGEVQDAVDGIPSSPGGIASIGPGRTYLGYYAGRLVAGGMTGILIGLGQWLVLRRTFRHAGWWVPVSVGSFAVGLVLNVMVPVAGVATGLALKWLWKTTYAETLTTTAPRPPLTVGWSFGLAWIWLTVLGFGAGSDIGNAIGGPIPESLQGVRNLIGWFGIGACVGAAQWVLLRRRLTNASWWVPASAVGWAVGIVLLDTLFVPAVAFVEVLTGGAIDSLVGSVNGAVVGASIGVMQWFVLRWKLIAARWWVLASAVAWALAYLAPWMGPASLGPATALGVITGSLTGIVLVWLLRRPRGGHQERSMA